MAKSINTTNQWDFKEEQAKKIKKLLNNMHFDNNNGKNIVHGRNKAGYMSELTKKLKDELAEHCKTLKKDVLDYTTDDSGNIDFFIDFFGDYVLYNTDQNVFYYWTGRLWRLDKEKRIMLWIQIAMRIRRDYTLKKLENESGRSNADALRSHVQKCCNQRAFKAIYEGIQCRLNCKDTKFDAHPQLLNVLNGTIDLKTGDLNEHNKNNFLTMMATTRYSPTEKSQLFKDFLIDTFAEKELIEYVQCLFGYCLTGETKEQAAFFFHGNGANGKSTLLSLVRYVMNDYAAVIPAKVLTGIEKTNAATSELAQLPHKRLVCCSELNCTDALNEGKIKNISGGETLAARAMYGHAFTYNPEFKCIVDTNYLPEISGTDYGIWRRLNVIPFEHTVSKENLNKNLLAELKLQESAVLAWLVKGAVNYYKNGMKSVTAVEKATKQYRKSQDSLNAFLDACVQKSKGSEVRARTLYNAYLTFCAENFLKPLTETKFGKDISTLGFEKAKDKISRKYVNIALISCYAE